MVFVQRSKAQRLLYLVLITVFDLVDDFILTPIYRRTGRKKRQAGYT